MDQTNILRSHEHCRDKEFADRGPRRVNTSAGNMSRLSGNIALCDSNEVCSVNIKHQDKGCAQLNSKVGRHAMLHD